MASRRDEILDAARACFEAHGYAATTIEQIAARSGASNGSIYHHFGAKDGILAALYAGCARRAYQDGLLGVLRAHAGDAEGGIRGAVEHHLALGRGATRSRRARCSSTARRWSARRARRRCGIRTSPRSREVRAWLAAQRRGGRDPRPRPTPPGAVWYGPAQESRATGSPAGARGAVRASPPTLAEAAWRSFRA